MSAQPTEPTEPVVVYDISLNAMLPTGRSTTVTACLNRVEEVHDEGGVNLMTIKSGNDDVEIVDHVHGTIHKPDVEFQEYLDGQKASRGGSGAKERLAANLPTFKQPHPLGVDVLSKEPKQPSVLIPGIMPNNAFGMVGPGGASKTTMMLSIMIHVVLDKPVWDIPINNPGPCLFVSAEDDRETFEYRLHRLCKAMKLTEQEQSIVGRDLFVVDVSGEFMRFVEADDRGNLSPTRHIDDLIAVYADAGIRLACFDPAVFFGPGERYVNDAESALMAAARKISKGLGGCAAGYIHHTGKQAARDKTVDQYAGRGGSAFADNSRSLLVLNTFEGATKGSPSLPKSVDPTAPSDNRVAYLTVAKFSAGKRPAKPFWFVRSAHDGFAFDYVCSDKVENKPREQQKTENETRLSIMSELYRVIGDAHKNGQIPTKSALKEKVVVTVANKKVSNVRVAGMIALGIQLQFFKVEKVPVELKQGSRTEMLVCGREPFIGAGGLEVKPTE